MGRGKGGYPFWALVLCSALMASACATTGAGAGSGGTVGVGVGAGTGGVRTGVGVSSGSGNTVLTSTLFGAVIGGAAGPIGLAIGALAGAAYGLHEQSRQEKLARAELDRQKQIDEDLKRQIEEQKKAEEAQSGSSVPGQKIAQDSPGGTGIVVVKDHRAEEVRQESFQGGGLLSGGAGIVVVKDHRAEELGETSLPSQALAGVKPAERQGVEQGGAEEAHERLKALEAEIEAELHRQKELLARIKQPEKEGTLPPSSSPSPQGAEPGKPGKEVTDEEGFKVFYREGKLVKKEMDQNGDGRPDLVLSYEEGRLARREEDTNFDGRVDAWSFYEGERLQRKEADTDGDGQVDLWAFYDGQVEVVRTEADTDRDGKRDLVSIYAKGELLREERYDVEREQPRSVVFSEGGKPVRKEEDTDGDGRMDRTTFFDGQGRTIKVAQDPSGKGIPTFVSSYDPATGSLLKEEEDLDGDGQVDVISYYEGGKLVRREFLGLEGSSLVKPVPVLPQEESLEPEVKKHR